MPNAELGHGGLIRIGVETTPGTYVFTPMQAVLDFSTPIATVEEIDVTSHSSPAQTAETIPGIRDYSTFDFSKYHKSGRADDVLLAELEAENPRQIIRVEITVAGDDPLLFPGFIRSLTTSSPVKGAKQSEVSIRIAGAAIGA